jgi:hypothetical protein
VEVYATAPIETDGRVVGGSGHTQNDSKHIDQPVLTAEDDVRQARRSAMGISEQVIFDILAMLFFQRTFKQFFSH